MTHPVNGSRQRAAATNRTDTAPRRPGFAWAVVEELRQRVATRLTGAGDTYRLRNEADEGELRRSLVLEELQQWILFELDAGRPAPADEAAEDALVEAVIAELSGLSRLAPLLLRRDIEDIHFIGCDRTMLRLTDGHLVEGPPLAETDAALIELLRAIGARLGDGSTSREFSTASPLLNVRLKGVSDLGARLSAQMDVVPRPSGTIRVHQHVDVNLDDLHRLGAVNPPIRAFLRAAVQSGASILVCGAPGVGKTVLLRALLNEVPWNEVIVTVEDDKELGTHLLNRHAVVHAFEQRMANAEGAGEITMGDALNQALRLSPTRLAVGEVRGGYVTAMLDAVTNGIAGAMCTIHSPSARGVFERVLMNALKANPAPSAELVMRSLSTLDFVVHVHMDQHRRRFISEVLELGPIGDNGDPAATSIFAPGEDGRAVGVYGSLSPAMAARLADHGFSPDWLHPQLSEWPDVSDVRDRP